MAKILLIDIETSPNLATVWGIWQQNISLNQLLESSSTLCYAAKWLGDDEVMFKSVQNTTYKKMLKSVHKLMDEADAIIHYNGSRFDIPTLNKEFLISGMPPPSPAKQIDLLSVARKQFRFVSNKLDYVSQALGLGKKTEHMGHELWLRCMNKDKEAWAIMEEYNKNDVVLLEKVYDKFKAWCKNHVNMSLFVDGDVVCPNCGGHHYQKRGFSYTNTSKFQRYQCQDCGNWFRGKQNLARKEGGKFVNV
jgi:DNA polymerase elongation subunit (family B)/rubredoxin